MVKQYLLNVYVTKMFLHNLCHRHVSALSWAIFKLNTFLCEVNHTVNKFMLLLSARYRVTSVIFIHIRFNSTVTVINFEWINLSKFIHIRLSSLVTVINFK